MKNKFPIIILVIFVIFSIYKIDTHQNSLNYNKATFKKYVKLVGDLQPYLRRYEQQNISKLFENTLYKLEDLTKQHSQTTQGTQDSADTSYFNAYENEDVMNISKQLDDALNKYTAKYLSQVNDAEKKEESKSGNIEYSYLEMQPIVKEINFDESKKIVQKRQMESLKKILNDKDYQALTTVITKMNADSAYLNTSVHKQILDILTKYPDIPYNLVLSQLYGRFEILAYYEIQNGVIVKKDLKAITTKNIMPDEDKKFKNLVNAQTNLLDVVYSKYFKGFFVFSDAEKGLISYASDFQNNKLGYLGIDASDFKAGISNDFEKTRFYHSVINELSKVILMSNTQIDYSKNKNIPKISDFELIQNLSKKDSYIIQFYTRFWDDLLYQDSIMATLSLDINARKYFYIRHKDDFMNEYVSQDPFKDMIESMTRFILEKKPTSAELKNDKIRFFYEFEEMRNLKDRIETNIRHITQM